MSSKLVGSSSLGADDGDISEDDSDTKAAEARRRRQQLAAMQTPVAVQPQAQPKQTPQQEGFASPMDGGVSLAGVALQEEPSDALQHIRGLMSKPVDVDSAIAQESDLQQGENEEKSSADDSFSHQVQQPGAVPAATQQVGSDPMATIGKMTKADLLRLIGGMVNAPMTFPPSFPPGAMAAGAMQVPGEATMLQRPSMQARLQFAAPAPATFPFATTPVPATQPPSSYPKLAQNKYLHAEYVGVGGDESAIPAYRAQDVQQQGFGNPAFSGTAGTMPSTSAYGAPRYVDPRYMEIRHAPAPAPVPPDSPPSPAESQAPR